jgi:hypothetical protein
VIGGLFWLPLDVSELSTAVILPGFGLGAVAGILFLLSMPGRFREVWTRSRERLSVLGVVLFSIIIFLFWCFILFGTIVSLRPIFAVLTSFRGRFDVSVGGLTTASEPQVVGRLVTVTPHGWLHPLMFALSDRASRPSDVGTVVILEPGDFAVGKYVSRSGNRRADARRRYIDVKIIDLSNRSIVTKTFFGSDPAKSVRDGLFGPSDTDTVGGSPSLDDIKRYLNELPRSTPELTRGWHHLRNRQYEASIRDFEIAVLSNNSYISGLAYEGLAKSLVFSRRCDRASSKVDDALAHRSNDRLLLFVRSWIYVNCEDAAWRNPRKAIELAAKASENTEMAATLSVTAHAYYLLGDVAEAQRLASRAVTLAPSRREYQEQLGRYREPMNDKDARTAGTDVK